MGASDTVWGVLSLTDTTPTALTGRILLAVAGVLQVCLVGEGILRRVLMLLVRLCFPGAKSSSSQVEKYSDQFVIVTLSAWVANVVFLPVQVVLQVAALGVRSVVWMSLMLLLLLFVYEYFPFSACTFLALYNVLVSPVVQALTFVLAVLDNLIVFLLVMYNFVVYLLFSPGVWLFQILGPNIRLHPEVLAELFGNGAMFVLAIGESTATYWTRLVDCANMNYVASQRNSTVPGMNGTVAAMPDVVAAVGLSSPEDLRCLGDVNYLSLDVMTPGLYARRFSNNVITFLGSDCSVLALPVQVLLFPLTDIKFWKAVHSALNVFVFYVINMAISTKTRCDYMRSNPVYSKTEVAVGCTPDWAPWIGLFRDTVRNLGEAVDDWMNACHMLVERLLTGRTTVCGADPVVGGVGSDSEANVTTILQAMKNASIVANENMQRLRIVGYSSQATKIAVVSSRNVAYAGVGVRRSAETTTATYGVGTWPFGVDVRLGVAPIMYGDSDAGNGKQPTGLLGCRCVDVSEAEMELVCASVPFMGTANDEADTYNASTVHRVFFAGSKRGLTCGNVDVMVTPWRFPRKRLASRLLDGDTSLGDVFDFSGMSSAAVQSLTVDAGIYIVSRCGSAIGADGVIGGTCPAACYPLCLGVHVAGRGNHNITMYHSSRWEETVNVRQADCGVAVNMKVGGQGGTCGVKAVELGNGQIYYEGSKDTLACLASTDLQCVSRDAESSFVDVSLLSSTVRAAKTQHLSVRTQLQPFVVSGDIMLTEADGWVVVSRMFDVSTSAVAHSEVLTWTSNGRRFRKTECSKRDGECLAKDASQKGRVTVPDRTAVGYAPSTQSAFAVHYADNPPLAIFRDVVRWCQDPATFELLVTSSWHEPRVWSVVATRADGTLVDADSEAADFEPDNPGTVSYMRVPDFIDVEFVQAQDVHHPEKVCDHVVNMKVVDLELINEDNILVTVLAGRLRDYDTLTDDVCDTCLRVYRYYYLHPNTRGCTEAKEWPGQAVFSCWRYEYEGPFTAYHFAQAATISTAFLSTEAATTAARASLTLEDVGLCREAQRLPQLGAGFAETVLTVFLTPFSIIETLIGASAALAGGDPGRIFTVRLDRPCMHSMLDSNGKRFLFFDDAMEAMDRALLYIGNSLLKMVLLLPESFAARDDLERAATGTANIAAYLEFTVDDFLHVGKSLKELDVNKWVGKVSQGLQESGQSVSGVYGRLKDMFASLYMNMRGGRKAMMKLMREVVQRQMDAVAKLRRQIVDNVRAKAQAAATAAFQARTKVSDALSSLTYQNAKNAAYQQTKNAVLKSGPTDYRHVKQLRNSLAVTGIIDALVSIRESIRTSFEDGARWQCIGVGQLFGSIGFAKGRRLKHLATGIEQTCMLGVDTFASMLDLIIILSSDMVMLDCVCKASKQYGTKTLSIEEQLAHVGDVCLPYSTSPTLQAWILELRVDSPEAWENTCWATMDTSMRRFETVFDQPLYRLDAVANHFGELFQELIDIANVYDSSTGSARGCRDYSLDDHVFTVIPSPQDYWMQCAKTTDCRVKCLYEYEAFEFAKAMVGVDVDVAAKRSYELQVDSQLFSLEQIEENEHLQPFYVMAASVLDSGLAFCVQSCGANVPCAGFAGLQITEAADGVLTEDLVTQALCMPRAHNSFVSPMTPVVVVNNVQNLTSSASFAGMKARVIDMHILQMFGTQDDCVLLAIGSTKHVELSVVFVGESIFFGQSFVMLTADRDVAQADLGDYSALSVGYWVSLSHVRVLPAQRVGDSVNIVIVGTTFRTVEGRIEPVRVCHEVRLVIDITYQLFPVFWDSGYLRACDSYAFTNNDIVHPDARHVCFGDVGMPCSREVQLPVQLSASLKFAEFPVRMEKTSNGFNIEHWLSQSTAGVQWQSMSGKNSETTSALAMAAGADGVRHVLSTIQVADDEEGGSKFFAKRVVVAPTALRVQEPRAGLYEVDVLVCNFADSRMLWLQVMRLELDINAQPPAAAARAATAWQERRTVDVQLPCATDSCHACVGPRLASVQAACYAAMQCGVTKCSGTVVSVNKPLCNLGHFFTESLRMLRLLMAGIWSFVTEIIGSIIELSVARRARYSSVFADDVITSLLCLYKDAVVEVSAVVASVLNFLVVTSMNFVDTYVPQVDFQLDTKVYARTQMTMMSVTEVITSLLLMPAYGAMALQRQVMCSVDEFLLVITTTVTGEDTAVVTVGMPEQVQSHLSSNVISVCLGAQERGLLTDSGLGLASMRLEERLVVVYSEVTSLITTSAFAISTALLDSLFAWLMGIVRAIASMAQVIDWNNCKLPVVSQQEVWRCVCNDQPVAITAKQRGMHVDSQAFWCSGPLVFQDLTGRDLLVWNPLSLDELLATDGVLDYVDCLSGAASTAGGRPCSEVQRPKVDMFVSQGVDILQVITRCRSNYAQKRWDTGALSLAIFTPFEWQYGLFEVGPQDDGFDDVRQRISDNPFVLPMYLPDAVWDCLSIALNAADYDHTCHSLSSDGWTYEARETFEEMTYRFTDACATAASLAADPSVASTSSSTQLVPQIMWAGSQAHKVPVVHSHSVNLMTEEQRIAYAETQLERLVTDEIRPHLQAYIQHFDEQLRDTLSLSIFSHEGDQFHQLVDCVMLGPFSAADMHARLQLSQTQTIAVPQYHRGDPLSRDFEDLGAMAGQSGSDSRRIIILELFKKLESNGVNSLMGTFASLVDELSRVLLDPQSSAYLCLCHDGKTAKLECCKADAGLSTASGDMAFEAKRLLDLVLEASRTVDDNMMSAVISNEAMQEVWVREEFAPRRQDLTMEQRQLLANWHAFNTSSTHTVSTYDVNDTPHSIGGQALWATCMDLLQSQYETLPFLTSDDGMPDVDTLYDAAESASSLFTHAVETAVHGILRRAHIDSPVVWSHVHRYVPSEGVWCDNHSTPQPREAPVNAPETLTYGVTLGGDNTIISPSLREAVFVGDLLSVCACGWVSGTGDQCGVPLAVCNLDAQHSMRACAREGGNYSSVQDLMQVYTFLGASGEARQLCKWKQASTLWGLLNMTDAEGWFRGEGEVYGASAYKLATAGPGGLRLVDGADLTAAVAEFDILGELRRGFNFHHQTTIAQPVCEMSLSKALADDLREYFADVFFPVSHAVGMPPASAACQRWVVDEAVNATLSQASREGVFDAEQIIFVDVEEWRRRCEYQVQALGLCVLRGVFDFAAPWAKSVPSHCPWQLDDALKDSYTDYYVTDKCLLHADGSFYDPCLCVDCSAGTPTLSDLSSCSTVHYGKLEDLREIGKAASFSSLYRVGETTSAAEPDMEHVRKVARRWVRAKAANGPSEGDAPGDATCGGMNDYWPDDQQHPVGYHPTMPCAVDDQTSLRGFAHTMSMTDVEGSEFALDHRLLNLTEASLYFGSGHVACDATAYAAKHARPNYRMRTKWMFDQAVDTRVPPSSRASLVRKNVETSDDIIKNEMSAGDGEAVDEFDNAWVDAAWKHSVGLLPHWLVQELGGEWPTVDSNTPPAFATTRDGESCTPPPHSHCVRDADCITDVAPDALKCLTAEGRREGICVATDTCFQHSHCSEDQLCSGEGRCVDPVIEVFNDLQVDVDVSFFSDECSLDSRGLGRYETMPDFAQAQGMCSYRHWYEYKMHVRDAQIAGENIVSVPHAGSLFPDTSTDEAPKSLREKGILRMQPHECDNSFEHSSLKVCTAEHVRAPAVYSRAKAHRFWNFNGTDADSLDPHSVEFCRMLGDDIVGFLAPYIDFASSGAAGLANVPDTIRRCSEFNVCPRPSMHVDGETVDRRRVHTAVYDYTTNRVKYKDAQRIYCSRDAETCGGVGYVVGETCTEDLTAARKTSMCVVDKYVVPLVEVLFPNAGPDTSLDSSPDFETRLQEIRQFCPSAFAYQDVTASYARDEALLQHFYNLLTTPYLTPTRQTSVTQAANRLLFALLGRNPENNGVFLQRGESLTMQEYSLLSRCVSGVTNEMAIARKRWEAMTVYDTPAQVVATGRQRSPGMSLYMFQSMAVIHVPWKWLWRCVLLGQMDSQLQDWYNIITVWNEVAEPQGLTCAAVSAAVSSSTTLSVQERIVQSGQVWTQVASDTKETDETRSQHAVALDINAVIVDALEILGVGTYPLAYLSTTDGNTESLLQAGGFAADGLDWQHEESLPIADPPRDSLIENIYAYILGDEYKAAGREWFDWTLDDMIRLGIIRERNDDALDDSNFKVKAINEWIPKYILARLEDLTAARDAMVSAQDAAHADALLGTPPASVFKLAVPFKCMSNAHLFCDSDLKSLESRTVMLREEIEYVVLRLLAVNMYSVGVFARGPNLHIDDRLAVQTVMQQPAVLYLQEAWKYNQFMREKGFECGTNNELDMAVETNFNHRQLRECVRELELDTGWTVPAKHTVAFGVLGSVLRSGVFPSFVQSKGVGMGLFLTELTALDLRSKGQDHICFVQDSTNVEVINPFWAGDFDIVTGCDASIDPSTNMRFIDTLCVECDRFENVLDPAASNYPNVLANLSRAYCTENDQETILRRRMASLDKTLTPLCQATPPLADAQGACALTAGGLWGLPATAPDDLHVFYHAAKQRVRLSQLMDDYTGKQRTAKETLSLLNVDSKDIAGHWLEFMVVQSPIATSLTLEKIHIARFGSSRSKYRSDQWMSRLKQQWAWQHGVAVSRRLGKASTHWSCPLVWLKAHSGMSPLWSPSADRNRLRFSHLTGDHFFAHPVVGGTDAVKRLRPGWFLTDVTACTAANPRSCSRSGLLQQELAKLQKLASWQLVRWETGGEAQCQRVLDWPHTAHVFVDGASMDADETEIECNVYDRIPSFVVQAYVPARMPDTHTPPPLPQVCRMGRMPLLRRTVDDAIANTVVAVTGCARVSPLTVNCTGVTTEGYLLPIEYSVVHPERKRRSYVNHQARTPCNKCSRPRQSFVRRDGSTAEGSIPSTARKQLSFGQPVALSSQRILARHIRRHVWGTNASVPDGVPLWTKENFFDLLFDNKLFDTGDPGTSSTAAADGADSGTSVATNTTLSKLRTAWPTDPWLFCKNGTCHGTVAFDKWIDPAARSQACSEDMQTTINRFGDAQTSIVYFCRLSEESNVLCAKLAEWQRAIEQILCQAGGQCTTNKFVYTPAMFDLSNREYVHVTIRDFYENVAYTDVAEFQSMCATEANPLQAAQQSASNQILRRKCSATHIYTAFLLLADLRAVSVLVMRLIYYVMQIGLQLMHLLTGYGLTHIGLVIQKIVFYIGKIFEMFAAVLSQLFTTLFQTLFVEGQMKWMKTTLRAVCSAINFVYMEFIHKMLCPYVISWLADFVNGLGDIIVTIGKVAFNNKGIKNAGMSMKSGADQLKNWVFCDPEGIKEMMRNCDALLDQNEDLYSTQDTLPTATRCWASYVPYFGDYAQLSCTAADTCRASLTSNEEDLRMCAACPAPTMASRSRFGCDAATKMCTCDVSTALPTSCFKNSDCAEGLVDKTCAYVDGDLRDTPYTLPCASCLSSAVCLVSEVGQAGTCSCAMLSGKVATCGASSVGYVVRASADEMCLYAPEYHGVYMASELASTPCWVLSPVAVMCERVYLLASDYEPRFMVVGHAFTPGAWSGARRLLQVSEDSDGDAQNTHNVVYREIETHNPLCQDLLRVDSDTLLPESRRDCQLRALRSVETLTMMHALQIGTINTSSIPVCAFCSTQDTMQLLHTHTFECVVLLLHPQAVWLWVTRHTWAFSVLKLVRATSHVLHQFYRSLVTVPTGSHARPVHTDPSASAQAPNVSRRHLLISEDTLTRIESATTSAVNELRAVHSSYTDTVSESFNYDYNSESYSDKPGVSINAKWAIEWPPSDPTLAGTSNEYSERCSLVARIGRHVVVCVNGLVAGMRTRHQPSTMPRSIGGAYRLFYNRTVQRFEESVSGLTLPEAQPQRDAGNNNVIVRGIIQVFDWIGVDVYGIMHDFAYTIRYTVGSLTSSLKKCDYVAVQTCSGWNILMLHSIILSFVFVLVLFVMINFLAGNALSTAFSMFISASAVLLYVSYGYTPLCAPLIPTCLMSDMLASFKYVVPQSLRLPAALVHNYDGCNAFLPTLPCVRKCQELPLGYAGVSDVLAWWAAELDWSDSFLSLVTVVAATTGTPTPDVEASIRYRQLVVADADADFIAAHRLCAVASSYLLLPLLMLLFVLWLMVRSVTLSLSTHVYAITMIVSAWMAAVTIRVGSDEEGATDTDEGQGSQEGTGESGGDEGELGESDDSDDRKGKKCACTREQCEACCCHCLMADASKSK